MIYEYKSYIFLYILGFILINITLVIYTKISLNNDELLIYFLDVGQGDAMYIKTPSNTSILIDTGPNSSILSELGGIMSFFERNINLIINTHEDLDHVGGLLYVLDRYSIKYTSKLPEVDKVIVQEINNTINTKSTSFLEINQGDRIIIDKERNIYIDVLYPDDFIATESGNDRSIVTKLVYGKTSFLFTGDISKSSELFLTESIGKSLKSDILKVAHHGSKTSSSEKFIETVNPKIAVIEVGEDNRFRHPHFEVINRLENFGIEILQTKNRGTIVLRSNGEEIFFED